ncbi:MAG: hemin receptor, partial [Rhodoglobus sp.]
MRTRFITAAVVLSGVAFAASGCSSSSVAESSAVTVTADLSSPLSALTVLDDVKDYSGLVRAALP